MSRISCELAYLRIVSYVTLALSVCSEVVARRAEGKMVVIRV